MVYAILKTFHLLAVMAWLGGMFFAHFCLRPAAAAWPLEQRLPLMAAALGRFFNAVSVAIGLILLSGGWMFGREARAVRETGGVLNVPLEWWVMIGLGVVMVLIFGHIRFALYRRLQRSIASAQWKAGAQALQAIRGWVAVNLTIGVVIVTVTLLGKAN